MRKQDETFVALFGKQQSLAPDLEESTQKAACATQLEEEMIDLCMTRIRQPTMPSRLTTGSQTSSKDDARETSGTCAGQTGAGTVRIQETRTDEDDAWFGADAGITWGFDTTSRGDRGVVGKLVRTRPLPHAESGVTPRDDDIGVPIPLPSRLLLTSRPIRATVQCWERARRWRRRSDPSSSPSSSSSSSSGDRWASRRRRSRERNATVPDNSGFHLREQPMCEVPVFA